LKTNDPSLEYGGKDVYGNNIPFIPQPTTTTEETRSTETAPILPKIIIAIVVGTIIFFAAKAIIKALVK